MSLCLVLILYGSIGASMEYIKNILRKLRIQNKVLLLGIILNCLSLFAAQGPAGYIQVSVDPEVAGNYIYDGITVLREIARRRHWQHPANPSNQFIDTVRAERDNSVESHEGRSIIYTIPIRSQNSLISREQREQYRGKYEFKTNLDDKQWLVFGPLFYIDPVSHAAYHVKVTQERWQRVDDTEVDFLIVSYKNDEKLRFIDCACNIRGERLNDYLPHVGLYMLESIDNEADVRSIPLSQNSGNNNKPAANPVQKALTQRWEKWRCLERNAQNANVVERIVEIGAPNGIPSIPGLGIFARNEKVLPIDDDINRLRTQKVEVDNSMDAFFLSDNSPEGAIIIFGPSGSGKTAFVHCFANKLCILRKNIHGMKELYVPELLPKVAIGSTEDTLRERPLFYHDHRNRIVLMDNPGVSNSMQSFNFNSTQQSTDIVNEVMLYRVLNNPWGIKLLLVCDQYSIEKDRGSRFIDALSDIVTSCPEDIILHQIIHLMVSKWTGMNILLFLQNSLLGDSSAQPHALQQHPKLDNKPRVVNLITYLLKHPERISTFEKAFGADDGQDSAFTPELSGARASILTGPFIFNPPVTIKMKASSQLLLGLARRLHEEMIHHVRTHCAQELIRYCREKIENHNSSAVKLRTEFLDLVSRLKRLSNSASPDEFLGIFDGVAPKASGNGIPRLFDAVTMREIIAHLKFIKAILSDYPIFKVNEWIEALHSWSPYLNTIHKIELLAQWPTVTMVDSKTMCLKGFIIGASDIVWQRPEIIIHAYNTCFIDDDIKMNNTHIYVITPHWKVIDKNKVIDATRFGGDHDLASIQTLRALAVLAKNDSKVNDYRCEYRELAKDELRCMFLRVFTELE